MVLLIVLRSEVPSGMCAKLRTAAANKNRDHESQSLLLLLAHTTYLMVLFFTHIPFVVNHTINATPSESLLCIQADGKLQKVSSVTIVLRKYQASTGDSIRNPQCLSGSLVCKTILIRDFLLSAMFM